MAHFYCKEVIGGVPVHYCYLEYGDMKILPWQSVEISEGTTVKACYNIVVPPQEKVAVQVFDFTDWKQLSWKEYSSNKMDCVEFVAKGAGLFGLPKRHEIRIVLYKYEGGEWKQIETIGPFYIDVVSSIIPQPKIVLEDFYAEHNTIELGDTAKFYIVVHNVGNAQGSATISLKYDGAIEDIPVTLRPDEKKTLKVLWTPSKEGEYRVNACIGKECKTTVLIVRSDSLPPPPPPDSSNDSANIPIEFMALGVGLLAVFGTIAYMELVLPRRET